MATPEQNIETVKRFFNAASTANFDDFDNYMVEKFVTHGDALFPFFMGREGMKGGVGFFKKAFPDATLHLEEIFAEGNNLNDATDYYYYQNRSRFAESETYGRSYRFGLSYSF